MADLSGLVDRLSELTVLEAAELSQLLEKKWGVSAAPVTVAPAVTPGTAEPEAEAQTEFSVTLVSVDAAKKIAVIKDVRAITGLGLKEAKEFVESAPKMIKEAVTMTEATSIKEMLEKAGGVVEIK